jgi:hypothetical protein
MWELVRRVGYWTAVCMSLRGAQNAIPSIISVEQAQACLSRIEPMIKIGVENLQKTQTPKFSAPPAVLWEKYVSEGQISV